MCFMTTIVDWISGVVSALTATASRPMIKSEDGRNSFKQQGRRNAPTIASPSLFGAWLTDTVTYHH